MNFSKLFFHRRGHKFFRDRPPVGKFRVMPHPLPDLGARYLRRRRIFHKVVEAPVIGLYGGGETGISIETVDQMRVALQAANKPGGINVYPEAQHGFNAVYRSTGRRCLPSLLRTVFDRSWFSEAPSPTGVDRIILPGC